MLLAISSENGARGGANMVRITDLMKDNGLPSFSYEVTPDLSMSELENLTIDPAFFSITWHAKSHQNQSLDIPPLRLAKALRNKNKNVLLHLSCDLLTKEYLNELLVMLQNIGIDNLLIILGESYDPENSDFKSSEELIKTIRKETGNHFCIGVAGFPDCRHEKLLLLQNKIKSGADFVITQAFFESHIYKSFLEKCYEVGIEVPILPGIFLFENYKQLIGFVNMCKVKVSQNVLDFVKNNDLSEDILGHKIIRDLIKSLISEVNVHHIHIFTLNKLENVSVFIQTLNE